MASSSTSHTKTITTNQVVSNGAQAIGDALVPGASAFIRGNIKSGTLHLISGLIAKSIFGAAGWLVVGADAYSESVTGKHLHEHFFSIHKEKE